MKKAEKAHVLVIANNRLQRLVYKDTLISLGYRVSEASSIDDISCELENSDVSFVIFDENLQENDAEALADMLKACKKRIRGLVFTSDLSDERKFFLRRIGYDSLLTKPVNLFDFAQILDNGFASCGIGELVDSSL